MSMHRMLSVMAVVVLIDFVTGYVKAYLKGELNSPKSRDFIINGRFDCAPLFNWL